MSKQLSNKLVSIVIPAFSRPEGLHRLLVSLRSVKHKINVIVVEDNGPTRQEIIEVVKEFCSTSNISVDLILNNENLGFDRNVRQCCSIGDAEFNLLMGDDDYFLSDELDGFLDFLVSRNSDLRGKFDFVIRSYAVKRNERMHEVVPFDFDNDLITIENCDLATLFKRSVVLPGFIIRRKFAEQVETSELDGTLLYHSYLAVRAAISKDVLIYSRAFVVCEESFRGNNPGFGSAPSESAFKKGVVNSDNALQFLRGYDRVGFYVNRVVDFDFRGALFEELDKFSYPILSMQFRNGRIYLCKFAMQLINKFPFGRSPLFYIYLLSILFFGERNCDRIIEHVRGRLGSTPRF